MSDIREQIEALRKPLTEPMFYSIDVGFNEALDAVLEVVSPVCPSLADDPAAVERAARIIHVSNAYLSVTDIPDKYSKDLAERVLRAAEGEQ